MFLIDHKNLGKCSKEEPECDPSLQQACVLQRLLYHGHEHLATKEEYIQMRLVITNHFQMQLKKLLLTLKRRKKCLVESYTSFINGLNSI